MFQNINGFLIFVDGQDRTRTLETMQAKGEPVLIDQIQFCSVTKSTRKERPKSTPMDNSGSITQLSFLRNTMQRRTSLLSFSQVSRLSHHILFFIDLWNDFIFILLDAERQPVFGGGMQQNRNANFKLGFLEIRGILEHFKESLGLLDL